MILKIAWRNIRLNRWRSLLTAGGIAVAVGMIVWQNSMIDAFLSEMTRGATALEVGQVRLVTPGYADDESIFEHFAVDDALFDRVESAEDVVAATPRLLAYGLVGNDERSQVASLIGVDPIREAATTPIASAIVRGQWLDATPPEYPDPRQAVIGEDFARRQGVDVGDELVVFAQAADGSLGNDLVEIVGVMKSGSVLFDSQCVLMHIDDAGYLVALEGQAHEVIVQLERDASLEVARGEIVDTIPMYTREGILVAQTWKEAVPDLARILDSSSSSIYIMAFLVYLIAGLGIFNVQRMSALERRREFAVLQAIGLRGRRLAGIIITEATILGVLGGLLGLLWGGLLTWYHAVNGLNMAALGGSEDGFSYMGVAFGSRLYLPLSPDRFVETFLSIVIVAILCGLIPAIAAVRVNTVQALSGRQ